TSVHVFCSASDPRGRDYVQRCGGEETTLLLSRGRISKYHNEPILNEPPFQSSCFPWDVTYTSGSNETITPRITGDDINRLNATEGLCLVEGGPNSGFTRLCHPVFVRAPHFCTAEEHRRYAAFRWPAANRFCITNNPRCDHIAQPIAPQVTRH